MRWCGVVLTALLLFSGCGHRISYRVDGQYHVGDPAFAREMNVLLGPPLVGGNEIETLRNGDEIFPAMLKDIRGARKTITFETYIYWSGNVGKQFGDAFAERARAGVKVHVLVDWYGSSKIDKSVVKEMKDAGVQFYEYHPVYFFDWGSVAQIDHRTHRKLLIVDGQVGYTGGVGIADEWTGNATDPKHWRDNQYRVQGPVVGQLQAAFMENWLETTGDVLEGEGYFPPLKSAGTEPAQVFKSNYHGGSESMQLLYLMSVASAAHTVRMETAYFVPDDQTIAFLLAARKRGVNVEIIVPGPHIDEKVVRATSRSRWGPLLAAGVKIYEYRHTMFHCKLLIVDDQWVSLGSSNLDERSFRLNDEANLNVLDPSFARSQIAMFEQDKARSRQISYELWRHRPLWEKVTGIATNLFGDEM
ncbi:MAG TPA: phospholipase D-like domain-containing protein [Phycisphaerae bacterium]|nr:phospholipase D-like domain-containing protein [Phycisphaerae bacterium]